MFNFAVFKAAFAVIATSLCAAIVLPAPASAMGFSRCDEIVEIARGGGVVSKFHTSRYEDAIECVVQELPQFAAMVDATRNERSERGLDYWAYVGLTGAALSVIDQNGRPAIELFRELDSTGVIQVLAAGARHSDRQIRRNSANLLSNVIDNSTICVVLDYLNAPVRESLEDNADIYGRVNLIYVANVMSQWAYQENARAMISVASSISQHISSFPMQRFQSNLRDTSEGLDILLTNLLRAQDGEGLRVPSSGAPFARTPAAGGVLDDCSTYQFRYWQSQNDNYFNGEGPKFVVNRDTTRSTD